eukprot:6507828-Alexandrium_andersonii.AAC.1
MEAPGIGVQRVGHRVAVFVGGALGAEASLALSLHCGKVATHLDNGGWRPSSGEARMPNMI